jgi:hypothetical protein
LYFGELMFAELERSEGGAYSGAGAWSNGLNIAISFGSGGSNSFEHQNKFLTFE